MAVIHLCMKGGERKDDAERKDDDQNLRGGKGKGEKTLNGQWNVGHALRLSVVVLVMCGN